MDGISIAGALATLGVDVEEDPTRDSGLDPAECMLLCMLLVNAVDDELHGLTASRMVCGTASMGARAIASARTLEDAIRTLCRFYHMIGGTCSFSLQCASGEATLTIRAERGKGDQRAFIEELLAHTAHIQLSYFFGALLPLTRFVTSTSRHPHVGRRHPYFLCPTVTGLTTTLAFPVELLTAQSRGLTVDYPLWEACRFWLARHPATRVPVNDDDAERPVSGALVTVLRRADLSIADCSVRLGTNLVDLRRDLASEGTSFRQVRQTALIERARPHLLAGCSVDDLAAALGYSDARSFRRALKLATGLSISDMRRDAQATVADRTPLMTRLRGEILRLDRSGSSAR
ncbi:AraC family transcriptional regulator [Sphingomonas bacterium]|uniref:AraC family transcriptional regulator n=1 Tax=Sphingomonas bacterium TaxID=1895847 RepID=UPI001576E105|nr:AraC family transcriptional regulator [Sphingomonas bacterium]